MYGTGTGGLTDLLPGLIFSNLEHDICICSDAAIGVITDSLQQYAQNESSGWTDAPAYYRRPAKNV